MSTFHGLEMAKQALFAQQSALYTTGHNISNANTDGYTRQRVNFQTMNPYPSASRNRPQIPGQLGTGVEVGSVQRIRDKFLDFQFRSENSKAGYWETKSNALSRMEQLLNEPSDSGLSKTMDRFWQSLQDLATHPEKDGARSVVLERGKAVAETFNYLNKSLNSIRSDLKSKLDHTESTANSIVRQISNINEQIKELETHGYTTNDLYDKRDQLLDQLSGIVNISVDYDTSHIPEGKMGQGVVEISLVDDNGNKVHTLPGGPFAKDEKIFEIEYEGDDKANAVKQITVQGYAGSLPISDIDGSFSGLIDSYGHTFNGAVEGVYPEKIDKLNEIAYEFVNAFNSIHEQGFALDGTQAGNFFAPLADKNNAAALISVVITDGDMIGASENGQPGNGENALDLSAAFDTFRDMYEPMIGELGVNAQEAIRMLENTNILRSRVENERMSVSSVSLDEEVANMIKFQHAYNAAARSMTTIDEMIDRIINNMGLVGR
ncbi:MULTISPECIES: flagellar hook-associated protein FlgK [unclassified Virgibacillus]|uniref:flagellar hook-associated protein FlgK n=1 Tax=unclassified Virgibacillus TaxID=2620237 RepID=UPI0024DEDC29|nr:flagellar hook-associated protein FlgK [Virgibacillus sp. LDC-1]